MGDRCFVYTDDKALNAAVANGRVSEHDAAFMRQFRAFLEQAPGPPPSLRKPLPEKKET